MTKVKRDYSTLKQRKERSRVKDDKYRKFLSEMYCPSANVVYKNNFKHIPSEKEISESIQRMKAVDRKKQIHENDWEVIEEIKEISFDDKFPTEDKYMKCQMNDCQLGLKQNEVIRTVNKLVAFINNFRV